MENTQPQITAGQVDNNEVDDIAAQMDDTVASADAFTKMFDDLLPKEDNATEGEGDEPAQGAEPAKIPVKKKAETAEPTKSVEGDKKKEESQPTIPDKEEVIKAKLQMYEEKRKKQLQEAADKAKEAETSKQPARGMELPNYHFDISPKLLEGLGSENPDERKGAYQQLIGESLTYVHTQIRKELSGILKDIEAYVPKVVQHMQTSSKEFEAKAQAAAEDFYKKFPMLNNPQYSGIIKDAIDKTMDDLGVDEYSPNLGLIAGYRVLETLGQGFTNAPVAVPAPTTAPAKAPSTAARKAPHTFGGNTRAVSNPTADKNQDALSWAFGKIGL